MSLCPKCEKTGKDIFMVRTGNKMVCPNCTYQYDCPTPMPTYEQLLKELNVLKELLANREERIFELEERLEKYETSES